MDGDDPGCRSLEERRRKIHELLAENIDDELETIFKTVTGENPAYAVVFEWVGRSFNDETASQKLLGVALKRDLIDQATFDMIVLATERGNNFASERWLSRSRRANKSDGSLDISLT
jgi:hypothetical protein